MSSLTPSDSTKEFLSDPPIHLGASNTWLPGFQRSRVRGDGHFGVLFASVPLCRSVDSNTEDG